MFKSLIHFCIVKDDENITREQLKNEKRAVWSKHFQGATFIFIVLAVTVTLPIVLRLMINASSGVSVADTVLRSINPFEFFVSLAQGTYKPATS